MSTTIVPAGVRTAKPRRPSLATPCDVWGSPLDPGMAPASDAPGAWFVLRVAPQSEFVTAYLLRRRGVAAWVPFETKWILANRFHRKAKKVARRPLLPGYAFVRLGGPAPWSVIFGVAGVLSVLTFYGRPWPLRAEDIAKLEREAAQHRARELQRSMPTNRTFEVGEEVEVLEGPFAGFPATVIEITASEVRALVMFFGRESEAKFPVEILGAVA